MKNLLFKWMKLLKLYLVVYISIILLAGCGKKSFSILCEGEVLIGLTPVTLDGQNNSTPATNSDASIVLYSSRDGRINNIYLSREPYNKINIKKTNFYANCLHPSLSNEGNKFSFTSDRYGDYDIFIMNTNNSFVAHRITSTKEIDAFPSFSNDDKYIVYCRFESKADEWSIRIHNLEDGKDEEIVKGLNPKFGINDNLIYYRKSDEKYFALYKYDIKKKVESLIYKNDNWGIGKFSLTKDGKYVIFSNTKRNFYNINFTETGADLWLLNLENMHLAQITTNQSNDLDPEISNDGYVFFTTDRIGGNNIWKFKLKY